ncbi:MerR family transcriptional regulator [Brachybacterium phenoliresistens]|uniref:MerR family transcriptional regulator n=1 Tax=Brachybacterium phenoliresistens TaxID=396014 RepID=Z9JUA9_9MICO|nr:MerR family transcriptional regulator [Brachybacterium phenoliresistens]EWS81583.1 MerR family transcriptional regulator [Brachybacterium phenoliresistens]
MSTGVTIGQAAAFAGVTIKTVRHYHRLGLVPEPERDVSGYRRYGPAELLRLVQVRALAGAGVPLAEVGPLLAADDDEFSRAIDGVERQVTARIRELTARRSVLRRLRDGDRTLLPDRAADLLARMPGLGFSEAEVAVAREGLVLARAMVPEAFEAHLGHVENALADEQFVALSRRAAEAATWSPEDPRLPGLAEEVVAHYLARPEHLAIVTGMQARSDTAARYQVVRDAGVAPGSAGERLQALVEAGLRRAGVRVPGPREA